MAASQTHKFMTETAVIIFTAVVYINPPSIAAYIVAVVFFLPNSNGTEGWSTATFESGSFVMQVAVQ